MPFKSWKSEISTIKDMYLSGMSGQDIARLYSCKSSNSIRQILKKVGVLRSQSEASKLVVIKGKKNKAIKKLIDAARTFNRFNLKKANFGEDNPRWLGNRKLLKRPRTSFEGTKWRKQVYERDNYTCQKCGQKGGKLQAHHIKDWFTYPALRYEVSNGKTLCIECHKNTDDYGWKSINRRRLYAI